MMKIAMAGYFSLCQKCGCHGHIVCANGERSKEFVTQAGGLKELKRIMLDGKIAEDEMLAIRQQIDGSGFETMDENVENLLETSQMKETEILEALDEFHREIGQIIEKVKGSELPPDEKVLH